MLLVHQLDSKLFLKSKLNNSLLFTTQQLIVVPVNVQMEVESITFQIHQAVLFVKVIPTLLSTLTLVSAHARPVITTFSKPPQLVLSFAFHVWPSFAEPVLPLTSPDVQLVLSELPSGLTMSAHVSQDIMNQTVNVKFAQPNVTDVKSMVSAALVLIHSEENSIKTVTAQLDSLMMVHQLARPATHFVKLVPTQPHVLHVSVKTTELLSTGNVFVLQDSIKLLTLITLLPAEDVLQNVKNVQDQLFVLTVMLLAIDSSLMMISEDKPVHALQDTTP